MSDETEVRASLHVATIKLRRWQPFHVLVCTACDTGVVLRTKTSQYCQCKASRGRVLSNGYLLLAGPCEARALVDREWRDVITKPVPKAQLGRYQWRDANVQVWTLHTSRRRRG